MKDNIFWKNRECDTTRTGEAHVIVGVAREGGQSTAGCDTSLALQEWTCSSVCNSSTNWRLRWCDDPALGSCSDDPCVPVSNVIYKVVNDSSWVTNKFTYCQGTTGKAKFTANWVTTAKADSINRAKVWFPSAGGCNGNPSSTKTVSISSPSTSHSITWEGSCQVGWFKFVVESIRKDGLVAVSRCDSTQVTSCPSCSPCQPPCEIE